MAYGPDTDEMLKRIADCGDELTVSRLQITTLPSLPTSLRKLFCINTTLTSLPELPSTLQVLYCTNTPITELPSLPPTLQKLHCHTTQITSLPPLPANLNYIDCSITQITTLPSLPPKLRYLACIETQIKILSELPSSLRELYCQNTPLLVQRKEGESIADYDRRWREWREEQASKKRIQEKTRLLKEEIAMAVWHPRKVMRLLEFGVDLEDM